MINTLNVGATPSTDTASLIDRLVKRADVNADGNVSNSEFTRFLTDLLATMSNAATSGTSTKAVSTSASLPSCLPGWNPEKWTNLDHQTPKYVVGRVLANYPPTPAGLQQALGAVQSAMPGTRLVGDDKLDIPNVGLIDVGKAFKAGGGIGWAWQVVE